MNRTTLIIIAGGFAFAILTALTLQMVSGSKNKEAPTAATIQMTDILVATKDFNIGDEIGPGSTQWVSWPASAVFEGAIVREADAAADKALQGRVRRPVAKGEPLVRSAMIDDTKSNFVTASLEKGKRAMAVTVNAQSSVGGFVSPGDYVDVVLTYDVRLPGVEAVRDAAVTVINRSAAQTVLENIKVLAVDQESSKQAEAKLVKTVTLELEAKDAETLALAASMGKLSLSLRGLGDMTKLSDLEGPKGKATTDMRISRVMKEIMRGENNAGSTPQVVRVYSGTHVQNVEVRPYVPLQ